jgi:magnesium transporter
MQSVDESQAIESFKQPDRVAWLHIVYQDRDAVSEFLEDALGFHELAVEDSLSDIERPTLHQYDDHLFLSASQVYSENGHENYTEIGFFLTNSALVTVAPREIPLVDSWIERWQKNPVHVGKRPVDLLHAVIDSVVDEYYLVAEKIEDEVDDLIDSISQGDNSQLQVLLNLKRRLNMLRRHVTPMRDIMNGLLRRDVTLIPADSRADFQDVYDHTLRLTELADINRDTLTSTLDVHLSTVSNNLNNVMKKMTVISTVLMSAALIAGIYGMNFKYMPELHWWFGYPFAILLMVVSGLLILGLFKLKRWI